MKLNQEIPRVALVGKKNVGKSSLLNAVSRKRYAITDETPGLTRDILELEIKDNNTHFFLSDTPGLDIEEKNAINVQIPIKVKNYLKNINLIVMVLNPHGLGTFDFQLIDFFRKKLSHIPIIYAVNKVDNPKLALEILTQFYEAGIDNLVPLSAKGRWNINVLLKKIKDQLKQETNENEAEKSLKEGMESDSIEPILNLEKNTSKNQNELKVAIVGKPNAGKSSLFNKIIGNERSIVSNIPGTTRDTVDTLIQYKSRDIRILDTAGMRKETRLQGEKNKIEFYSLSRTKRAIRESKIVIQLVDGELGFTDFDKRICSLVEKYSKAVILSVSKWDIIKKENKNNSALKDYQSRIEFLFPHVRDLPLIFSSASTGHGIEKILDTILDIEKRMDIEISTSEINSFLHNAYAKLTNANRNLKLRYITQKEKSPPAFIFFVNNPKNVTTSIRSFFTNCIRNKYKLQGLPIKIYIRKQND